jgi:hypothetical protein
VTPSELDAFAFPVVDQKIIAALREKEASPSSMRRETETPGLA